MEKINQVHLKQTIEELLKQTVNLIGVYNKESDEPTTLLRLLKKDLAYHYLPDVVGDMREVVAAPDLLRELDALTGLVEGADLFEIHTSRARAAISKAKGG